MRTFGRVREVSSEVARAIATGAMGAAVTVSDSADFPKDGGQFTVGDSLATIYSYEMVADGDTEFDPDILGGVSPALSVGSEELELRLYPNSTVTRAQVEIDGFPAPLPAVVPYSMLAQLPEGARSDGVAESVELELRGSVWHVKDVIGEVPRIAPDHVEGLYSPDKESYPQVHVGGGLLEIIRATPDDGPVTTIRLGGEQDSVQIINPATGVPLGSMNPDGSMSTTGITSSGDISMNGRSLSDVVDTVDQAPLGVIAAFQIPQNTLQAGSSLLGIAEVNWIAQAGRMYRVVWDGYLNAPANNRVQLSFRQKIGSLSTGAGAPGTNDDSLVLASGIYGSTSAALRRTHLEAVYQGLPGSAYQSRVLLAMNNIDANAPVYAAAYGSVIYVEDMGRGSFANGQLSTGGGTPYAASSGDTTTVAPPKQVRTYTTTWNATWMASCRTDGASTGGTLQQGYYAPNYRRSAIGFNTDPASSSSIYKALQGASVQKVELYLKNVSFYSSDGGNAVVDASTLTAAPGSIGAITGRGLARAFKFSVGEGKWVTLTSDMWAGLQDGSTRSLVLLGSTVTDYAKFSQTDPPKIRITYTK